MTSRAAGIALACAVVACGDPAGPGGPTGSGGSSGTSSATSGSSSDATAGGGDDGAGGAAGGAATGPGGGSGGAAGGAPACPLTTDHVAAGASFTCAVATTTDATLRCRGGVFGPGWATVPLEGGEDARCVEHVAAEGEALCVRVAAGAACPAPGVWCAVAAGSPLSPLDGSLAAPVGGGACALERAGTGACSALDVPDLTAIAPLAGLDGGARDACAWGSGGVRCWGATASLADDAPDLAGCPADVAVGDGFACVAWSGFDVVDCWGDLPPSIPPRVFIAGPAEDVAVGDRFVCARTVTGLVRCWGDDLGGGLGVAGDGTDRGEVEPDWPSEAAGVAPLAIAAGVGHVATIDGAGPRVLAWGRNDEAQVCSCATELVETPVDAEHPDPEP